jgi:hypothetical protein
MITSKFDSVLLPYQWILEDLCNNTADLVQSKEREQRAKATELNYAKIVQYSRTHVVQVIECCSGWCAEEYAHS